MAWTQQFAPQQGNVASYPSGNNRVQASASTWGSIASGIFLVVSTDGIANGGSTVFNGGSDYGPDTAGTATGGIQEALNAITSGGVVYIKASTSGKQIAPGKVIFQSGNYQTVVFEGGCYIKPVTPYDSTVPTNSIGPSIIYAGVSSAGVNYHNCSWIGNGCIIDSANFTSGLSSEPYSIEIEGSGQSVNAGAPYMILVDNFELINCAETAVQYGNMNGSGYQNTITTAAHQIEISRIYAHSWKSTGTGNYSNGITTNGSAWQVWVHDCTSDMSTYGTTNSNDYSNCFVYGNQGNAKYILFERCNFTGNNKSGQTWEFQGAANSPTTTVTVGPIHCRQCTFASGATAGAPLAGSGGGYIDDTNGGSNGIINEVWFEDCDFPFTGLSYLSATTAYGYIRFTGTGYPGAISGTLDGRSAGQSMAITVGASPFAYVNSDMSDEFVIVDGGTVSAITLDGVATGLTGGTFLLQQHHTLSVTYSAAPTMTKIAR